MLSFSLIPSKSFAVYMAAILKVTSQRVVQREMFTVNIMFSNTPAPGR